MNDDTEDEIIYELISVHLHMIWKYTSLTSTNIAETLLPGPGESFKSIMLQPGPFMLATFLVIVISIILQTKNKWVHNLFIKYHNVVVEKRIKQLDPVSLSSENAFQEFSDGIAGAYAIQGKRGTMEDRHCIMQDVDIGDGRMLSFFGVYDGHGGQYVAEYVKEHLFKNTVEKIREQSSRNKPNPKNGITTNINGSPEIVDTVPCFEASTVSADRRQSTANYNEGGLEITKENIGIFQARLEALIQNYGEKEIELQADETTSEAPKSNEVSAKQSEQSESTLVSIKVCEINGNEDIPLKKEDPYSALSNEELSLKKEDPYSAINLRKRSSFSCHTETNLKENDAKLGRLYMDNLHNINYTKLLTDQIMEIDKKVVSHCKTHVDLSGTTAVIAVLDGELLIIGNVGDSRAVMGDMNGFAIPLSFDHKPNQLKERRRIKDAGGFITFNGVWRVAGILATSRAVGDFVLKDPRKLVTAEPDVLTFSLKEHKAHFVILATDGLWDVLSNEEAVAFVRKHIHEQDFGAKSLVLHAYNKGSQDNITVVILDITKLTL